MADARELYPSVDYAYSCVPTYPDGQIGFIIASKSTNGEGQTCIDVLHVVVPAPTHALPLLATHPTCFISHAALALRNPRSVPAAMQEKLRYYSSSIHRAAFVLPRFAEARLASVRPPVAPETGLPSRDTALAFAAGAATVAAIGVIALTAMGSKRR